MIWPTIFALATSLVIVVLNVIMLSAYRCGSTAADRWARYEGYYNTFATVIHTTFTTAVAGVLFGTSTNQDSLNSQTCSPAADAKQQFFPQINLGNICNQQVYRT
jgi:hypothetical protein